MMESSWSAFLLAYFLGGVTFLPLVVITILVHAYLTFPRREDLDPKESPADDILQPGDDVSDLRSAQKLHKDESRSRAGHDGSDVAAGYFAVCREYTPMGINAKPIERSTPVGSATVGAPSPSVYQAMYRSIFERKQVPGPLDSDKNVSQRFKKAGNVFYIVLRHGHLMLFDDDEQLEVRHVISLAHHDVSIFSGGDTTPEGELWIKKNAICLSRRMDGVEAAPDTQLSKPFFLFSENCSAKEDFYFALLRNQEQAFGADDRGPRPLQFEVKNIIHLVQKLHSAEEHLPTRWLNAMIGRVFLGVHQTADIEKFIRAKLTKKISRVKRPAFLSGISIQKIETGESAPFITNPRLRDLNVEGECVMEADVKYTGNFRLEVAATARIDLGSRFKAREVNIVLAVVFKKLEGHALFKIKPPPSNRIWFSFQQTPKMEMSVEPIISSRQITYTVILRQIENRIKEVIAETVVLPFWDDVPFFSTEHKRWRGGIWEGDDAVAPSADPDTAAAQIGDVDEVEHYEESGLSSPTEFPAVEKSQTVPLESATPTTGLFGRRLNGKVPPSPRTTSSSTGIDAKNATPIPIPVRSGAFSGPATPTTGMDATNADIFKPSSSPPDESPAASAMASISARSRTHSTPDTPVGSPHKPSTISEASSKSSASSREATDTERDQDQTPKVQGRRSTASSAGSQNQDGDAAASRSSLRSSKGSIRSQTGSLTRGLFARKDASQTSVSTASTGGEVPKRNTLAAVTNAAVSAKQWGISALQRHKDGRDSPAGGQKAAFDLSKPMGGGQPLPPPGVPLPGPDKRSKATPTPTPTPASRRKVPPPPLPMRRSSEERKIERRPVPAPPLPKRMQLAEGEPQSEGDDMLVVAAPMDSEPTTPSTGEPESFVRPWAEDAEDGGEAGVQGPAEAAEQVDPAEYEADDDGELSAWMDQDQLAEPGSSVVTSEGMAQ